MQKKVILRNFIALLYIFLMVSVESKMQSIPENVVSPSERLECESGGRVHVGNVGVVEV